MADQHLYPETQTRLANELNGYVARLRDVNEGLPGLKKVMDQIASGSDWASLATELGYSSAADAEAAYNLIGSLLVEMAASPFLQQVLGRMG